MIGDEFLSAYTGPELDDSISKKHTHTNKALLDSLKSDGPATQFLAADGIYKNVPNYDVTKLYVDNQDAITLASAKTYVDGKITGLVSESAMNTALGNKVDKVAGKGLSTNDYTTPEQTKVALIRQDQGNTRFLDGTGAYTIPNFSFTEVDPVWNAQKSNYYTKGETDTLLGQKATSEALSSGLALKVDKVNGMGLSSNDITNTHKSKVDLIITSGDGTKYLSDDGTYKTVQSGGATPDEKVFIVVGNSQSNPFIIEGKKKGVYLFTDATTFSSSIYLRKDNAN
jgi:hypothetical protein